MMRTIAGISTAFLLVMMAVPTLAQTSGKSNETIVLGAEIAPKDTTKHKRFTNRLIAPKGEWQCGMSVMYSDFNSDNSDYMLLLQGLNARASMLRIAPEASYTFKENHSAGVRFTYAKLTGILDAATADLLGNLSLSVGDINAVSNSMGGSVFQRTYIGIDDRGRFGIFWDYILGYTRSRTHFTSEAGMSSYALSHKIGLAFAPGLIYFPMNNISIQANISIADISYSSTRAYENGAVAGTHKDWKAMAGLNLLNLNFGLTIHL